MNKGEHWFSLIHCIRPRMEFTKFLRSQQEHPEGKSMQVRLDEMMTAGEYPSQVRQFLKTIFKTIQNELIEPYLEANPPKVTNDWNLLSGALTFFSGEAKQAFTHFINWDKPSDDIQQEVNPGFFHHCQQKRWSPSTDGGCEFPKISDMCTCGKLRDCLGKFLEDLHYSCSRFIERKVPVRTSLSLNLETLNKIAPNRNAAKRVYYELCKFLVAAPEYPLYQGGVICPARKFREVLGEGATDLSPNTCEWIVNIYEQIVKSPLFSVPDNPAFSKTKQAASKLHIRNLEWLARKDQETGHPYSLREFGQLVLALTVIYRAPRFYILHFGPAVAGQRHEGDDLPVGTGTLVMNSVELCDELLGYITILSETAISSLARAESFVLQGRLETTKRNLYLAESAYGVGHTQKDRFTRIRAQLAQAEDYLRPAFLNVSEALSWVGRARTSAKKAAESSLTMDFMANLFQVNGQIEKVDTRWHNNDPYNVAAHIRSENKTFKRVIDVDLTPVEDVLITDNLPNGKGRLYDEFYDDIIHEMIANALNAVASTPVFIEIKFTTVTVVHATGSNVYDCCTFTNKTKDTDFENRLGLKTGQWSEWVISENGPKGALRQAAIRLKATKQGLLFAKPERRANECLFSVGLYIVKMKMHKEVH